MRTDGVLIRPVRTLTQLSTYPRLCERIRTLASEGLEAAAIAERLNDEGFRPPKQRDTFGRAGVGSLMRRLGVGRSAARAEKQPELEEHEWLVPDLARQLDMPAMTLHNWAKRGWLKTRHVDGPPRRRLVVWANEAELDALRERRARPSGYYTKKRFLETEAGEPTAVTRSKNNAPQE